jgi:hypothetical protein
MEGRLRDGSSVELVGLVQVNFLEGHSDGAGAMLSLREAAFTGAM